MIGVAQKISAIAVAIALGLGVLTASRVDYAFAQNEPEPEATPIEEPQAEPTEFTPVTAGDAERGAPAPIPEAATSPAIAGSPAQSPMPAESATPAEVATPAESPSAAQTPSPAPSASAHTTISRERSHSGSRSKRAKTTASTPAAPGATPSTGAPSTKAPKPSKGGGPGEIVPENSPFAGMNFGNQKGPTNVKSDTGTLDYQNKSFLFTGHVHAVQAGGDLTSDTLKVQYGQDFNDIKMMYADGNVRMSQGTQWITSEHAVLNQTTHLLTFRGNPVAHDAADQITGSLITVDMVTGKSTVENPRVVIFPREAKNPDNVDAPSSP